MEGEKTSQNLPKVKVENSTGRKPISTEEAANKVLLKFLTNPFSKDLNWPVC